VVTELTWEARSRRFCNAVALQRERWHDLIKLKAGARGFRGPAKQSKNKNVAKLMPQMSEFKAN